MAHCCNCSAPLPSGSIRCEYCGSRNDIDLKGINYHTTNQPDSERICPRCGIGLKILDLRMNGTFLIERCEECLGLFFDPGELEALLEAAVANVFFIDRGQLGGISATMRRDDYGITYIKCPVCSTIMNRVNFGARSGVIVDRCKAHGVWLDGGELRHLLEWMKAGGKILQQENQEQRRKEEERAQEGERRRRDVSSANSGDTGFSVFGGTLQNEDQDLFEIVRKAMNLFLK